MTARPRVYRRRRARPGHGQTGSALVELTWLGILLLVPLVYVIVSVVTVQQSAFGATEAARAAGRAFVLAPDEPTAQARAVEAARVALSDQGVTLDPADLQISCRPGPDACLTAGSSVEVRLDLQVPLPLAPSVGSDAVASVHVEAVHVERYGVYREAGAS